MSLRTQSLQRALRFETFELDPLSWELRKNGIKVKVQEQPLKILAMLASRPGELVLRDELREGLWSNDTFVNFDRGLNTAVNRLRSALDDSAQNPRFIETVGSRGYRFIAPVTTCDIEPSRESLGTARPEDGGAASKFNRRAEPEPNTSVRRVYWVIVSAGVALAMVVTTLFGLRLMKNRAEPSLIERIKLTKLTDNGKAATAAISRDGRYVAYLLRDGLSSSLRMRQLGATQETHVLENDRLLYPGLTFSPDGGSLYFLRATSSDALFKDLFQVPTFGGSPRKVTSNVDAAIAFSPDGRQFAYERGMGSFLELRLADVDGTNDRLLAKLDDASPDSIQGVGWSPDGKLIAVPVWRMHAIPGNVLYVVKTANGTLQPLYTSNREIGRPRWLPGGKSMVVPIQTETGSNQLWTVSYPEGKVSRLTNDLADYDFGIDITQDGRMITALQSSAISNLWATPTPGTQGEPLTQGEQRMIGVFSIGDKIAILNRAAGELWIMNSDGTRKTIPLDANDVTFSPCGPYIVFTSFRNGTQELMRMNNDGSGVQALATGAWGPVCSPDGKFAYYVFVGKERWKIRRVSIDGGTALDFAESPVQQIPGHIAISPDGKLLAFPFDGDAVSPTLKLGVIAMDSGALVKTFDVASNVTGTMAALRWSIDGRAVQYILSDEGATNIIQQPLSGGPAHPITRYTSGQIFDFNWTPDGKRLLICRGETSTDVVLVSNLQ